VGPSPAIKLPDLFPKAQFKDASVAGYWPLGTELDVRPLMNFLSNDHELSLPCTPAKGEPLVFKRWSQGQKLVTGLFGTKEPVEGTQCIIPDLVLVPLLAFSSRGERLGYGGGYYDRTLTNLRQQKSIFACGVAYAAQQTEIIPTNNYDALLDGILTGANVLTLGNHSFDQAQGISVIENESRILRPCNYPVGQVPGRGAGLFNINGYNLLVINVHGRVFMDALDDPFVGVERELSAAPLGEVADAVIVDMHAEATSEKNGMGYFCDGRASLVVGTHQHVPTADARILPEGTAYQTDAGMCGDYNSIIGMDVEEPLRRFTTRMRGGRFNPASGPGTLCGVYVETNGKGLAEIISPIRVGGQLQDVVPAQN